ncbi:hypothetical protein GGR52DRAFT_573856 [Hypoxylon sp. FL1284]|nr:hypothetical protein GGR52DRAFT_573856 [Hypoxylon sp. FL1284]
MKSALVLATTAAVAVAQVGYAAASLNARLDSSTSQDTLTGSATLTGSSLASTSTDSLTTSTVTGSDSSASLTSSATISSSVFVMNVTNATSTVAGITQTLGGIRPSVTISGPLTESPTPTSSNVAATPVQIGAGVLAGVFGIIAAVL